MEARSVAGGIGAPRVERRGLIAGADSLNNRRRARWKLRARIRGDRQRLTCGGGTIKHVSDPAAYAEIRAALYRCTSLLEHLQLPLAVTRECFVRVLTPPRAAARVGAGLAAQQLLAQPVQERTLLDRLFVVTVLGETLDLLALDRQRSNLAMARYVLAEVERELSL